MGITGSQNHGVVWVRRDLESIQLAACHRWSLQGTVLLLALFDVSRNDLDDGIEVSQRVPDDAKLSGEMDTLEGRAALKEELDRLQV